MAVNKIDVPGANPEKVRGQLTEFGLVPEEYGGDTMFVDISAKQNLHVDKLLEAVLLTADAEPGPPGATPTWTPVVPPSKPDSTRVVVPWPLCWFSRVRSTWAMPSWPALRTAACVHARRERSADGSGRSVHTCSGAGLDLRAHRR